ncbi:MAG: TolC family protein [Bryobacterales bacterium]|nr:TolC family protein [Bryobacterales bacterium]MBV9398917.1 TolC family protein [Bryobacterales bacterium]
MKLDVRFLFMAGCMGSSVYAQTSLTWQQIKERFEAANPSLKAAQASIAESRAGEITAHLRPNPDFTLTADGFQVAPNQGVWQPLSGVVLTPGTSYLVERGNKRNLRYDVAKQSTAVSATTYVDQERGLLFTLRNAFVQTLQAKAVLANAQENLAYWDRELEVSRTRFDAGDIAQVELNRLEAQRFQFESDLTSATVSLRTAKIQLRQFLNDTTPIDQFDIDGPFDYRGELMPLEAYRKAALESRPDLKAAAQNIELARLNHKLAVSNGAADVTVGGWYSRNASFSNPLANNTVGGNISIPLRINDRNQGEKARTQIDIGRNERLRDATQAQVLSDVDSAYETLASTQNLLRTRERYLKIAEDNRNTIQFSYQNGGASLLDYLDTEKALRDTRLAFINLVGSYLTTAAQMNQAVGREVIP